MEGALGKLRLMAKITFITPSGDHVVVEAETGNLMAHAVAEGVEGIHGDCGGLCSCATCHVKVHPDWMERVGAANETERDMLEMEDATDERSRLSCQIEITEALDGLVVEVIED
jgi:2Fe-2S ferredoxin